MTLSFSFPMAAQLCANQTLGNSCKRTEKLRLESSKGLDDVVLLLPDGRKADGGGRGGGVHGDCHHYQQHQAFQRHRDWFQCNLLVWLLRWSVSLDDVVLL